MGIGPRPARSLGDADADLRSGTPPDPYRLFEDSSRVLGTTAVDLRAGVRSHATHRVRGACAVRPSGGAHDRGVDVEGAPTIDAVERPITI